MKTYLYILLLAVVAALPSCSKDDDENTSGIFKFQAPQFVRPTNLVRVDLSVACDAAPVVTFTPDAGVLGVVSPTQDAKFGVDYIYAGEPVAVTYENGRATGTFWYIPLSDGQHGVTFTVNYTRNGVAKSDTAHKALKLLDAPEGGFYPEVIGTSPGYYYFGFRNELDKFKRGCKIYLAFASINDQIKDPAQYRMTITQGQNVIVPMTKNEFYPITPDKWDESCQNWVDTDIMGVREELVGAITLKLIFRDDYNRCRDVVVKTDADCNVISSKAGDYYLWPR